MAATENLTTHTSALFICNTKTASIQTGSTQRNCTNNKPHMS